MKQPILSVTLLIIFLAGCLQQETSVSTTQKTSNFMEQYAERDDVIITQSGLMYRVLSEGEGDTYPRLTLVCVPIMRQALLTGM
jgi:FKBP-type peptidyl-prolyl cis-trans isomerase